jgi:prevent-host-death family protein
MSTLEKVSYSYVGDDLRERESRGGILVPMIKVSLKEAEGHLGELIEEAAAGQEVVITSAGGPTVRLLVIARNEQEKPSRPRVSLPTFRGQGLRPGVNLDDSAALLEVMESPHAAD